MANREYQYVGPEEILEVAKTQPSGTPVLTREDISAWLETDSTERLADGTWIATFTIGTDQVLYLAPRRSEHVACARCRRPCACSRRDHDRPRMLGHRHLKSIDWFLSRTRVLDICRTRFGTNWLGSPGRIYDGGNFSSMSEMQRTQHR